jgi:hypothetical protein
MRRIGCSWTPLAITVTAFVFAGLVDARPGKAEDEGTPPAPPATETQANVLGTPEPQVEDATANEGRVSLSLASDFTTAYFFRGILQERNGFIWQPSAEIYFNLWEGDEDSIFTSVDFGVGVWNSFHSNKTLAEHAPSNLYETDIYPMLSASFPNDIEMSLIYYVYTSPNGAFDAIQNFDIGLAYDDSELWGGGFSTGPSITVSFELDSTNFGDRRGSWLGLDASPSFVAFEEAEYPVTLALPLALGLSISEYYEVEGEGDETFGFFSFGLSASVPLAFVPEDYGAWSANAGINVYVFGENLEDANLGDQLFPVGTGGIRMDY